MNFQEYLKESERTLIDMGKEKNLLHASLGLITEFGELVDIYKRNIFYGKEIDIVNVKEELGDLMWYLAIIFRIFPQKLDYKSLEITDKIRVLYSIQDNINDIIRISDFYNLSEISFLVNSLYRNIERFAQLNNFTLEDVMQTNIDKLKARFPEKFTNELALNRDLEAERKVLENSLN